MSNEKLIEQAREAIDNMDDFARMANVVATGPLLVLNSAIDALELADKRIAELEADLNEWKRCRDAVLRDLTSAQYKLAVAREACKDIRRAIERECYAAAYIIVSEALAQIGGEDGN